MSAPSIRQQIIDRHVAVVAGIADIMGAIDEPPLEVQAYETPPPPRPGCGAAAHPFAFCFEDADEETAGVDDITGMTVASLTVVDEVAYRFEPYGDDGFKRAGRHILARLQTGVLADPNCGGLVHFTREAGNGLYLVPGTSNLAVAQQRWAMEYSRARTDPYSREALLP